MSLLAPLLEIQDLDVAADAARARSESLAEREVVPRVQKALFALEAELSAAKTEHLEKQAEEEQLGGEVSQLARDIEAAEVARYSGDRKTPEEAALHEASQAALREDQSKLEEGELELLAAIESLENRIGEHEASRAVALEELDRAVEAIRAVEAEVERELEGLAKDRHSLAERIPPDLLKAYDRVRAQARAAGRGAAQLSEGRCKGCRISLPSLEVTRMLAQPEDALIQCPQCRRVLIRL